MKKILLRKPKMSGFEIDYIKDALAEDWAVPLGPDVTAFEEELKQFMGAKEVVALNSGTSAMHLALLAAGVEPGDEVLVQSFTFCASCNPVVYIGAKPVFIDSERKSWNMDPMFLEMAINDRIKVTGKKPKAIIPVALYGMPYDIGTIMTIADKYGIPVVEDAAEAFGSEFNGRKLGTFGRFGVLSFNGNKMMTTSGGGAVICPDKETKDRIMWYATQARENLPYYHHEEIGYNYRLSNISACIGRGQLKVVGSYIDHHRHVHALYSELLKEVKGIKLHDNPSPLYNSNFWLCNITLDSSIKVRRTEGMKDSLVIGGGGVVSAYRNNSESKSDFHPNQNVENLRQVLAFHGVESRPLWKPMHRQPVYKEAIAYNNGVSDELFKTGLCLPAGPYVTDEDIKYIVDVIMSHLS